MDVENENVVLFTLYKEAQKLLKEITPKNVVIERYFNIKKTFKTKNDIFYILLVCLQDKQMSDKVIGLERPERKEIFRKLLFDFDSAMVLKNYDAESLLETFNRNFTIRNIESKTNLWRLYAKSILSGAQFLNSFETVEAFDAFVNSYATKRMDLPLFLQSKIFGMGFALACHFLKELGYSNYAKPDVHIRDIFVYFHLCDGSDSGTFHALEKMALLVNDTPYNLDKLLWLVCSGNFHMDKILVKSHKDVLIERVTTALKDNKKENQETLQVTKLSKFENSSNYNLTLNEKVVHVFFNEKDLDKQALDVLICYDKENDCLLVKKVFKS